MDKSKQTSLKNNTSLPKYNRGLYDIDNAIKYYVDNIISPTLDYNGEIIGVPFLYASGERWASIKKHKFVRDKNNKIESPLITFKRTSVESDDSIPVGELRSSKEPLIWTGIKSDYNKNKRYSLFSELNNKKKIKDIYNIIIPDYIILSYELLFWTDYVEHMNKLIEMINFHSGAYWGDDQRKFPIKITDFSDISEISLENDRLIKWSCSIRTKTYIMPDINLKYQKVFKRKSIKKVKMDEHII